MPLPHTGATQVHSFGLPGNWQNFPVGHVEGPPKGSHSSSGSFRPSPQTGPHSIAVVHGMPGCFVRELQTPPVDPTGFRPFDLPCVESTNWVTACEGLPPGSPLVTNQTRSPSGDTSSPLPAVTLP